VVDILQTGVFPREAGGARSAETGSPAPKLNSERAWLRELERAQWEQRPVEGKPTSAPRGGHAAAGSAPRASPRSPAQRELPRASAERSFRAGETAGASGRGAGARIPGPAPESSAGFARLAALVQAPAEPAAPRPSAMLEAMIEMRLRGEARHWERRKALVLERGGRIRVWLRDAELSAGEAQDAVAWLAGLARDAGLELEAVTINGCVVFEIAESERGAGTLG